jgi:hypothetical protein
MKKQTTDSSAQTTENKNVQTAGHQNWRSPPVFGSLLEDFSCLKVSEVPETQSNLSKPVTDSTLGLLPSFYAPGDINWYLSTFRSTPPRPTLSVPFNPIYSEDDEVMKAANKFLRSVEKRKNRNADSEISSSESSHGYTPQQVHFTRSSSSTGAAPSTKASD